MSMRVLLVRWKGAMRRSAGLQAHRWDLAGSKSEVHRGRHLNKVQTSLSLPIREEPNANNKSTIPSVHLIHIAKHAPDSLPDATSAPSLLSTDHLHLYIWRCCS